jgi:hypothetical protein
MFKSKNIEPNDFHKRIMDKLSNDKREALAQKSKFVYSHFFDIIILKNEEKYLRKNVITTTPSSNSFTRTWQTGC